MPIVLTAVDGANFCDMGRAPCFSIPRKILCLAGREHGRAIPLADSCIAANCAIGCLATLGTSSLSLGGQQPLGRLQKRCPVPARSNVQGAMFKPRGHTMSEFTFLFRGSDPTAQSPEEMQKSMQKWLAWFKE